MYRKTIITGLACLAIPMLSSAAYGEDIPQADITVITADQSTAETVTSETDTAISDADLTDMRGGQAIVIGTQTLTAVNSGSVLNGNYTAGSIALSDNALSNFNGLGNVLINTGAQNNLQSAMNVTINFAQ